MCVGGREEERNKMVNCGLGGGMTSRREEGVRMQSGSGLSRCRPANSATASLGMAPACSDIWQAYFLPVRNATIIVPVIAAWRRLLRKTVTGNCKVTCNHY